KAHEWAGLTVKVAKLSIETRKPHIGGIQACKILSDVAAYGSQKRYTVETPEGSPDHPNTNTNLLDWLHLDEDDLQRLDTLLEAEDGKEQFARLVHGVTEEMTAGVIADLKRTARDALANRRSRRKA